MSVVSDPWVSGTHVGKYELLQRLAIGGMAEIYLARATGIEGFAKLVVLKRILPQYGEQQQFVRMFLDEARLAARLDHPHVAQVYDIGHVGENYFFTMEFVHGQDARHVVGAAAKRGNWLPIDIALGICSAVASGLHYAHEQRSPDGKPLGIVHRDVSLTNILVSYDGAVKVLDFGIAKANSHTSTTLDGTLKGKLAYMSPEQCRGESLDRRSDIFALGIVLYQLTAMSHPFGAKRGADNDLALLNRIISQEPPAPSKRRPEIPAELERIILKALDKDPTRRYQTALELLEDIEAFALENRIAISPVHIRRFMQDHFSKEIEAWRTAETQGISLAEHVVSEHEKHGTPSSGILSADNLAQLREVAANMPPPDSAMEIPSSDDIVPELHDTLPQITLRPPRRWPILAGAGLFLTIVCAIVFWPRGGATPNAEARVEGEAIPLVPSSSAPTPSPSPTPQQTPPLIVNASPDEVTITLRLDPPDAKVVLDGAPAAGPTLTVPRSDRAHKLVVSASGFARAEREVKATDDTTVDVTLEKRKGPKRVRPKGYVGPMETDL